jgi:hypothetical protein
MIEKGRVARCRVCPCDVTAFSNIAGWATQAEIITCCFTLMFFGDDVIDMKSEIVVILTQATVFTAIASTFDDFAA